VARRDQGLTEVRVYDRMHGHATVRPSARGVEPELADELAEPRIGGDDFSVAHSKHVRSGGCYQIDALVPVLGGSLAVRPEVPAWRHSRGAMPLDGQPEQSRTC